MVIFHKNTRNTYCRVAEEFQVKLVVEHTWYIKFKDTEKGKMSLNLMKILTSIPLTERNEKTVFVVHV